MDNVVEEGHSVELGPLSKERRSRTRDEIVAEMKNQMKLAGPLVSVNLMINLLQVISLMFVGHLGELPLSGASMATSFASATGFTLLRGLGSALETFCGQSYGAKQYHMLGVHLQRAMTVQLLTSIPLAFMWANTNKIMLFFNQDPEISAEAGIYARFLLPSIFGFALQECHIRFLQTQNIVIPMMITTGITTLLHVFLCWVLVFWSGLGIKGAAMATSTSYWINATLLLLYVRISSSCKRSWNGFSWVNLREISIFLKLAISSTLMLSLEVWSFDLMILLSGLLPNPKLEASVLSISLNTATMIYMIPLGLSGALSTRVSNELGGGRPKAACLAICVAFVIIGIESISMASILISRHKVWGYLFSGDEKIVKYVGEMLLLVALSHVFDGIQSLLSGITRGCGWQNVGAIANLGAYYLIGIPCSIVLAFACHMGGKGLWIGITVALFVQAFFLAVITLRADWEKEAKRARDRVYNTVIIPIQEDTLP